MKAVHEVSKEFLKEDGALDLIKSMLKFKPNIHAFSDNSMFFGRKNCMTIYFSNTGYVSVFVKSKREDIDERMSYNTNLNKHLKIAYYNIGLDGDDFVKEMVTIEIRYVV